MKTVLKKYLPTLILILALYFILFSVITIKIKYTKLFILGAILLLLCKTLYEIVTTFNTKSEFKRIMCEYLKTYSFILSKIDTIPKLTTYNIYKCDSFDKVLELAMEDRVNIYYLFDDYTCDFLFTSGENLYIFTLKEDEKYYSRVDKYFIEQQIVTK